LTGLYTKQSALGPFHTSVFVRYFTALISDFTESSYVMMSE